MNKLIVFIALLIGSTLQAREKPYISAFHIGWIKNNDGYFGTICVSKQYIFKDFMIGMDLNVLTFGQEKFNGVSAIHLTPKIGMLFIGDDKSDFYTSVYVNSGITSVNSKSSNSLGYAGGVGLETRYLNYGLNIGYLTNISKTINFEGMYIGLNYWL